MAEESILPIPGLGTVGPTELIILLSIVLLLFGAKKIPELARGLRTGVREFKKGTSGAVDKDEMKNRQEDKELPQGEAARNERVRAQDDNARAERAGQKH